MWRQRRTTSVVSVEGVIRQGVQVLDVSFVASMLGSLEYVYDVVTGVVQNPISGSCGQQDLSLSTPDSSLRPTVSSPRRPISPGLAARPVAAARLHEGIRGREERHR